MLSTFLLLLQRSVLDMIRQTVSFLGVSSVFGETENASACDSIARWTMNE